MPENNNSDLPKIRTNRLQNWDYTQTGWYFITICTLNREKHFGKIKNNIVGLSIQGCICWFIWTKIPEYFPNIIVDAFIVMPDHLHGIIGITNNDSDHKITDKLFGISGGGITKDKNPMLAPTHLGKVIRWFKGRCTFEIKKRGYSEFAWQSRYYDHIIRNEKSYLNIRDYILNNPINRE